MSNSMSITQVYAECVRDSDGKMRWYTVNGHLIGLADGSLLKLTTDNYPQGTKILIQTNPDDNSFHEVITS
jgi:hypothetical protein